MKPSNAPLTIQILSEADFPALMKYLTSLSVETRHRFGPHSFDLDVLYQLFTNIKDYRGYIAQKEGEIIAYTIVKFGYLEHDYTRLSAYGLNLEMTSDCTIAPSVGDTFQSQGIGGQLIQFAINDLSELGFTRIILWGGVQSTNSKAVGLYRKYGFKALGQFEHNGMNLDMIRYI